MKNINDLRETLFETMQALKDGKMDVAAANAVSNLGKVIVESTKTEIQYMKQINGAGSQFLPDVEPKPEPLKLTAKKEDAK